MAVFTVREVCTLALRKTGVLAPHETAAEPAHLQIAQDFLDMMVRHETAVERMPWLHPDTIQITPPAGQRTFDLLDFLPAGTAPEGVQYPVSATFAESGQEPDQPLRLIRREEYEALERKNDEGRPEVLFIDRLQPKPTASVWRVQPTDGTPTYTINLVLQTFVPDLTGRATKNEIVTKLPQMWNMWLVHGLAAEIGDGPIVTLDRGETRDRRSHAADLLEELAAYANDEHADQPRNAQYNDASGVDPRHRPRRSGFRYYGTNYRYGYD